MTPVQPPPEKRLYTCEVILDEGSTEEFSYLCFTEPEWVTTLWDGGHLPEWVRLETISGARVAIRSETIGRVTVDRRLAADLDDEVEEPVPQRSV